MTPLEKAQNYLSDHWHTGFGGEAIKNTADAASLLSIKENTLKTRLAREQALVMREPVGSVRSKLTFTGYQLAYNLLSDRLLRYGFKVEHEDGTMNSLVYSYVEYVHEHVLNGERDGNLILKFRLSEPGSDELLSEVFTGNDELKMVGDAALFVPIGAMINQMAIRLLTRAHAFDMTNA